MRVQITAFGCTPQGTPVALITLEQPGIRCRVTPYGATLVCLEVQDMQGVWTDVVLGFDSLQNYQLQNTYMGATVGRCANRIRDGHVCLNGTVFQLTQNESLNHLHGGNSGFDRKLWQYKLVEGGVQFQLTSPHLEEGYPGTLKATVVYQLTPAALYITYSAVSDQDTLCNLTNHTYFILNGHCDGSILDHELMLYASRYTPVHSQGAIPTGEICPVQGTPMDFLQPHTIADRMDEDFSQLSYVGGYDHNYVLDEDAGALRTAARLTGPKTGISMTVHTTSPGIQLYTGNFLTNLPPGKGGGVYRARSGLCLETQYFPDAIHHPHFSQPILHAGTSWNHQTVYEFSAKQRPE